MHFGEHNLKLHYSLVDINILSLMHILHVARDQTIMRLFLLIVFINQLNMYLT